MRLLQNCFESKLRNKVYSIGALHFILICSGIWSLVVEMISFEEPVTDYEQIYIGVHYAVHLILILCLFIGTYTDIPYFLIPWILAGFIPFSMMTLLALTSMNEVSTLASVFNWAYVVVCWYCWSTVCTQFIESINRTIRISKAVS